MDISSTRTDLIQRGKGLESFTILWNSVEGLLAVGTGIAAGSISLVGFASDRLCAFPFAKSAPERSRLGIAIGAAALFVMPLLARAKRNVGSALRSPAMIADSQQTQFLHLSFCHPCGWSTI